MACSTTDRAVWLESGLGFCLAAFLAAFFLAMLGMSHGSAVESIGPNFKRYQYPFAALIVPQELPTYNESAL